MNNKKSIKKNETIKLCALLALCLILLVSLILVLIKTISDSPSTPAADQQVQYIEISSLSDMKLPEAKSLLDGANISYEIVPTSSKIPNKVENFEYIGKNENGKIYIEVGTSVKLYANEVESNKIIYLTFDDGPIVNYSDSTLETIYHNTGEILDILDQYGIKASFFLAGYQMVKPDRSQYVLDIYNGGHIVACHSFSHDYDYIYSSSENFVNDIERFEKELKIILGEEKYNSMGKYIRFPGGTVKNGCVGKATALDYISSVRQMGYKIYDWTLLTNDAYENHRQEGESDRDYYLRSLKESLELYKNVDYPLILLMHDKNSTKEVLPEIIEYLISEGYYFDTIDNCPEYTDAEK